MLLSDERNTSSQYPCAHWNGESAVVKTYNNNYGLAKQDWFWDTRHGITLRQTAPPPRPELQTHSNTLDQKAEGNDISRDRHQDQADPRGSL